MTRINRSPANVAKMDKIARPYVTQVYKDAGIDNPKMIEQTIKREVAWLLEMQREEIEGKQAAARVAKMPASKKQPTAPAARLKLPSKPSVTPKP